MYGTPAWRAARLARLASHPLCERCSTIDRPVPATVVHHRTKHKGDWSLFVDPRNHESVCKPCHDGPIQSEECRGFSRAVDEDGWPIDASHPANRGWGGAGQISTGLPTLDRQRKKIGAMAN
jgi:hypothetical protein